MAWMAKRTCLLALALAGAACGGPGVVGDPDAGADASDAARPLETDAAPTGDAPSGNRAPVAADDGVTLGSGASTAIDVLANDVDPDGDALSILAVGAPAHGTAEIDGGQARYQPEAGFRGEDAFSYVVSDGRGGLDDAMVVVTVGGGPDAAPTAGDDAASTSVDLAVTIEVLANDVDPEGGALTIASVGDPAGGTATIDGEVVVYTPDLGFSGEDAFSYEVRDPASATATAMVRVRVYQRPLAVDDVVTTAESSAARIDVLANDSHPDGQPMTLGAISSPAHGIASLDGAEIVYQPEAGYAGPDAFTYELRDDAGGVDTGSVTVVVTPALVSGGIAAGGSYTLAVRADGTLVGWGAIPRRTIERTPAPIGARTDWALVTAAPAHACVIDTVGALWCWGSNGDGQLGLGDTTSRVDPTQVGTDVGWTVAAAGRYHTCGIRGGALSCWGENDAGKLGLGDTTSRGVPTTIASATPWTAIATGDEHTCGIRGGEMWCWGHNGQSQLGDPSGTDSSVPVRVGTDADWREVAAGAWHTCAIRADGSLWCWGRVGGSGAPRLSTPARIGTGSGWSAVAASAANVCAIDAGALYCWGDNAWGQVGDGTQTSRTEPARVGVESDWTDVAVGGQHACAIRSSGAVSCWGARSAGQVGDGTAIGSRTPARVGADSDWASVTSGIGEYTCATRRDGSMWCWGILPAGSTTPPVPRATPTQLGTMTGWTEVLPGARDHLCAMRSDGGLWCWGSGTYGRLGLGTSTSHGLPQPVGGTTMFVDAGAGDGHTCGVTTGGALQCWGLNAYGMLGTGSTSPSQSLVPLEVSGPGTYASVAAGALHTCGVRSDGSMWCWGYRIGAAQTRVGTDSDWRTVRASRLRSCGIKTSGALWCWADEGAGLARVGLDSDWANVSMSGAEHTCGVRTGGSLWCFGDNRQGQLGDGTISARLLPTRVGLEADWADVAAGGSTSGGHTCGVRTDGTLWCWGNDDVGQLGLGLVLTTTPVPVDGG